MSLRLTSFELCDLEMLLIGSFHPLKGFLNEDDYLSVITRNHLSSGELWPIPIILTVDSVYKLDQEINLCTDDSTIIAILKIESIYTIDPERECILVAGTYDPNHPYTQIVRSRRGNIAIGGTVRKIRDIQHYNYTDLRITPTECKDKLKNYSKIVAFQTRNPLHRSHVELMLRASKGAHLLLSPIVGLTQPGDVDPDTRVRCYRKLLKYLGDVTLMVIPLAMRMLGPREALWHALIRKNYGATHFIVGRDHAGPSSNHSVTEQKFYSPRQAQEFVLSFQKELEITIIPSEEIVYISNRNIYLPLNELEPDDKIQNISGTQFRKLIRSGEPIPDWFSYPEIIEELRESFKKKEGICIYFVGLSGAGKSTLARGLQEKLMEMSSQPITFLDGDLIRQNLSQGLGFSRKDRSINVRRVGFVASEIVKHGGTCICATISPYEDDRQFNRSLIEKYGRYFEVFVNTPLEICESRDVKGLYQKARRGEIKEFTGISDPFEIPTNPDLIVNSDISISEILDRIM